MPPAYGASISSSLGLETVLWFAEQVYKRYLVLNSSCSIVLLQPRHTFPIKDLDWPLICSIAGQGTRNL